MNKNESIKDQVIYVVRCDSNDYIKVGLTTNI